MKWMILLINYLNCLKIVIEFIELLLSYYIPCWVKTTEPFLDDGFKYVQQYAWRRMIWSDHRFKLKFLHLWIHAW